MNSAGEKKMFYVETVGHRWATQALQYGNLDAAMAQAQRESFDCFETRVYDCSSGPVGVLVATYARGQLNPMPTMSQQCRIHGLHGDACPRETTLGTAECQCVCHN